MPPFRNILGRKSAAPIEIKPKNEENIRPSLDGRSSAINFGRKSRDDEPNEYKLCVVNDSGVYLPPSPPEKQSFWSRHHNSFTSSNHRSLVNENEPFSISRESFDSYRRSFDISAKSPVTQTNQLPPRASLDSRFPRGHNRPAINRSTFEAHQSTEEDAFEDVGLGDDEVKPKKRGFFSRFGDSSQNETSTGNNTYHSSSHLGFRRKREQGSQESELGNITSEPNRTEVEGTV